MHWSFPTGSSLPSPDHAPGLGHLPALPQRRRDGQASGVPVSGPRSRQEGHLARRHLHNRPATPLELPGTDWGGSNWGSDQPPLPTGNEREREATSPFTSDHDHSMADMAFCRYFNAPTWPNCSGGKQRAEYSLLPCPKSGKQSQCINFGEYRDITDVFRLLNFVEILCCCWV